MFERIDKANLLSYEAVSVNLRINLFNKEALYITIRVFPRRTFNAKHTKITANYIATKKRINALEDLLGTLKCNW
jgi:hypothetical protein